MKKLFRSFGYAFNGIALAIKTQLNFRIHIVAMLLVMSAGYIFHISTDEWKWITLCITLVLTSELMNTALETLTDLISPERNTKAGMVKDLAAAGVVITAIFSLAVALVIFLPKILALLGLHYKGLIA